MTSADTGKILAEVLNRPTIEEIVGRYTELHAKVRDKLSSLVDSPFQEEEGSGTQGSPGGCGTDFPGLNAQNVAQRALPLWISSGNLPDVKWQTALDAVSAIAKPYGFDKLTVVQNRPGIHSIEIADQYGGRLNFGTAKNTVTQMFTSCHPFAASKSVMPVPPASR
jgi:hypothetical protein